LLLSHEFWVKQCHQRVYKELETRTTNTDMNCQGRTTVGAVADTKINLNLNQGVSKAMVSCSRASQQFRVVAASTREIEIMIQT